MPRSGESASSPKFRPRFWIPQMDDKIPGLEKTSERAKDALRSAHVRDAEDGTVDQPCTNTGKRLAVDMRKRSNLTSGPKSSAETSQQPRSKQRRRRGLLH